MPQTIGNAAAGTAYTDRPPDLPRDTGYVSHRPWCVDCKRKHDADQLNADQLCDRCARAAVTRAEAAARRAREAAERPAAAPTPVARTPKPERARKAAEPRQSRPRTPRATPARPPVPMRIRRAAADRLDVQSIIAEYRNGDTCPTIATRHGVTPKRIYGLLDYHGIERRDDRAGHSGGKPLEHRPEDVAQVREMYNRGLSMAVTAERLGIPIKRVEAIMRRHGITRRQGQTGRVDGALTLSGRMAALGVTSAQVKAWAADHGLIDAAGKPGIPSTHVVDAYEAAHPAQEVAS